MNVRWDTTGADALEVHLANASREIPQRTELVVRKTTLDIERDGKVFAPVDTGYLMGSITSEFIRDGNTFSGITGPTAEYGIYVELGTSRMGPQPYMGPATDRHEPLFEAAMRQMGYEVLRG